MNIEKLLQELFKKVLEVNKNTTHGVNFEYHGTTKHISLFYFSHGCIEKDELHYIANFFLDIQSKEKTEQYLMQAINKLERLENGNENK